MKRKNFRNKPKRTRPERNDYTDLVKKPTYLSEDRKRSRPTLRPERNDYTNLALKPRYLSEDRILLGIPMTGLLRSEWALARYGQVIPCNWSHQEANHWINQNSPLGFAVAEARNVIIDKFIHSKAQWLFFIDHDVVLPPDCFVRINRYMTEAKYPVVCGLYFAKCDPPEPLLFRGRGNGCFRKWKLGEKVWVDGVPFGCTLIHRSLLEVMYADAPEYIAQGTVKVRRVIDTPAGFFIDPQKGIQTYAGTEDLAWCNRVIAGEYLKKAGWKEIAKQKYPFLADTGIFCRHITFEGVSYPLPQQGKK